MDATACIVCRTYGLGMIAIYHHPNELDKMFLFTTGIKVKDGDHLCVTCYDELKVAYRFKLKSVKNSTNEETLSDASASAEYHTSHAGETSKLGSNRDAVDRATPEPEDEPVENEVRCEVCRKTFKSVRLLQGHMMAYHQTEEALDVTKFFSIPL
ncbi:uncharacterized protein LOC110679010 [Aedes aegypti]|uniref:Uncharacterized protein n=1 Tax=Aedes aegypti TaxID=7159 RepID=A0A6I8U9B8_AEDAE|nr:uncharacterized protein LOC110679010 [Aedes aegypti]